MKLKPAPFLDMTYLFMTRYTKKIIITRRVWQLIGATAFVLMAHLCEYSPISLYDRVFLFVCIFLIVFSLALMREERRATLPADSIKVINWNLAESAIFLFSLIGYFVFAFIRHLDKSIFYAYFHTGALAMLSGLAIAEFLWHNTSLRKLDDTCQRRYWANYKDSIWG